MTVPTTGSPSINALAGSLSERYRVEREIGAGGMATVYLAQDLRHQRRVALKVLRPELAAVIGADRFLAEIRTTAGLQHPNIAPLFDSGESDGQLFYVMPYVEGETLRGRLSREKQLPIADAVRIASEVASALDYAHRHGIVHRDIKPENILLHDGRALVADFGIALAVTTAAGGTRMTETGMSLGTPSYMSPEQAMGEREITPRADVYALGAVLYEMLAGEPPFTGPTAQAIVARVVTGTPMSLREQRPTVPVHVEAATFTALQRLPADRFATAADFATALDSPGYTSAVMGAAAPAAASHTRWRSAALAAAGIAAVALALSAWSWSRSEPAPVASRFNITFAPGEMLRAVGVGMNLAISRDGSTIAYVGPGEDGDQLWIRRRDQLRGAPVPGTTGAVNPFFSPDGRHVGVFLGSNFSLKIVPVSGGVPTGVFEASAGGGGGGAWSDDGYVYSDTPQGFVRMRAAGGGEPELVAPLDSAGGEAGLAWPDVLPGGKAILLRGRTGFDYTQFALYAIEIPSGKRHPLGKGLMARWVAPGRLVILRADGVLVEVPFDERKLRVTGEPRQIAQGISTKAFGAADLAVSHEGMLMYVPGRGETSGIAEAVWVDRAGVATQVDSGWTVNPRQDASAMISPDGSRLAYDDATGNIWVKRLPHAPASRLTFEGGVYVRPLWMPDGQSVAYISVDSGRSQLLVRRADGSGTPRVLFNPPDNRIDDAHLSGDGRWLVYRTRPGPTRDLYLYHFPDSTVRPLLTGPYEEHSPAISPDGRWLAYVSNESGRMEVYVRPFPNVDDGRWQISNGQSTEPAWSRDGRELYYRGGIDFYAVDVTTGDNFSAGDRRLLFRAAGYRGGPGSVRVSYSVAPDGRFAMLRLTEGAGDSDPEVVVVMNWLGEGR
jgi:eukaryotic-like serine/threonine-protein kinase